MNRFAILFLIILAGLIRLVVLIHSDNFEGTIAADITIRAMRILECPNFIFNLDYSPFLHTYLIAALLWIKNDPIVIPRLLSLILGAVMIYPFSRLVELLFGRAIAILSAFIVAIYPLHIMQSVVSTSEMPYLFFLFSALYFIFRYIAKGKKMPYLIAGAILLNLASMVRLEGWIFIPLLALLLFRERRAHLIVFLLIASIFPVIWLALSYYKFHNPFIYFVVQPSYAKVEVTFHKMHHYTDVITSRDKALIWPAILDKTLPPYIFALGCLGIAVSVVKKRGRHLILFFAVLSAFLLYKVFSETILVQPRYTLTLGLFLIPYAGLSLYNISVFAKKHSRRYISPVFFTVFLMAISFGAIKTAVAERPLLPNSIKELASWLKAHAGPQDKIIIDQDEFHLYPENIILHSRIDPDRFFVVSAEYIVEGVRHADKKAVLNYLSDARTKYMVFAKRGYLREIFHFDNDNRMIKEYGYSYKPVYDTEYFTVYEMIRK